MSHRLIWTISGMAVAILSNAPIVASDGAFAPCRVSNNDAIAVVIADTASLGDSHPREGPGSWPGLIAADGESSSHPSAAAALAAAGLNQRVSPHCIFNVLVVYEKDRHFPNSRCRVDPKLQRCVWNSSGVFVYRLDQKRDPSGPNPLNFLDSWDFSDDLIGWSLEFEWIQEGPRPTPPAVSVRPPADAGSRAPATVGGEDHYLAVATSPSAGTGFDPGESGQYGIGWHTESQHDAGLTAVAECRRQGGGSACFSDAVGKSLRGGCVGLAIARWRDRGEDSERTYVVTSSSFRDVIARDLRSGCGTAALAGKYEDTVVERSCEVVRIMCADDVVPAGGAP